MCTVQPETSLLKMDDDIDNNTKHLAPLDSLEQAFLKIHLTPVG